MSRIYLTVILLMLAGSSFAADSPNIVLILTDDQGWSQRSGAMHPDVLTSKSNYLHTPNMDRIATAGMRFTNGYSPATLCTPTRRSILNGTSAARSGTEFDSAWVPARHMTIPKAIKEANPAYQCAHFGKWGEKMISSPEECGYDASDGHTGNGTGGVADKTKPFHIVDDPKRTDSVTKRSIDFMRRQVKADKPFYLQVSYYAVHLRIELLKATLEKYQQKGAPDRAYSHGWAGMLEELDRGIGELLDAMDELDISRNTYVVFMTDNGGRGTVPGGDEKSLPTNAPLSGAKHSLQEGGIRVPFLVRGPSIEAGSDCHVPVVGYDLLPTFYELTGGEGSLSDELDGGSFVSLFTSPQSDNVKRPIDGMIFSRPRRRQAVIRQGDFKLLCSVNNGKLGSGQLFNVQTDISEKKDLASSVPEKAKQLQDVLAAYLAKFEDPSASIKPKKKK